MLKKPFTFVIPVVSAVLLLLLLNPFGLWMPMMATYLVLALVFISYTAFVVVLWNRSSRDERDKEHSMVADKLAYYVGVLGLLAWALIQALVTGHISAPLVVIVVLMILVNYFVRWYLDRYK
jgi:hypothetical protein